MNAPASKGSGGSPSVLSMTAVCSNGNVIVRNPTGDSATVLLQVGNGTMKMELPAGEELNESNVTNGTIYTKEGTVSYSCR